VLDRSRTSCSLPELKGFVAGEIAKNPDPYQLVNGHDVAAILGIALRRLIGTRKPPQTWANEVEAGLRLAFDWEAMRGTGLYGCIRRGGVTHKPYRVFRH